VEGSNILYPTLRGIEGRENGIFHLESYERLDRVTSSVSSIGSGDDMGISSVIASVFQLIIQSSVPLELGSYHNNQQKKILQPLRRRPQ